MSHDILFGIIGHHFSFFIAAHFQHFYVGSSSVFLDCPNAVVIVVLNWDNVVTGSWKISISHKILLFISFGGSFLCSFNVGAIWSINIVDDLPDNSSLLYLRLFVLAFWVGAYLFYWLRDCFDACYFVFGHSIDYFLVVWFHLLGGTWVVDDSGLIWDHFLIFNNLDVLIIWHSCVITWHYFNGDFSKRKGLYPSVWIDWDDAFRSGSPVNLFLGDCLIVIRSAIVIAAKEENLQDSTGTNFHGGCAVEEGYLDCFGRDDVWAEGLGEDHD